MIPTFLGFALVGVMIKKLGVVGTLKFSFGIGIISNVLMIFLHNNFTAYMVLGCFTTFGNHSYDVSGWSYDDNGN